MTNEKKQLPALASQLGLPDSPVTEIVEVQNAMHTATAQGCNVLAPTMDLQFMPPGHQMMIRAVQFDARFNGSDSSNGTWYKTDGGNLALHGSALNMLAAAAGISIVSTHVERTTRHVWSSTVHAVMTGFDGARRFVAKSKVVDLREGSDEARGMSDNQKKNARKHGAALCESKASNRVIRAMLGLKTSYTKQEAAQPFVFPTLVFMPDMDNPEIAKMVTARALGIVADVYGTPTESGPIVADVSNMVDGDARALTDQAALDDIEAGGSGEAREKVRTKTAAHPDDDAELTPPPMGPACEQCGTEVGDRVAEYSKGQFGKVLCRPHQPRR